MNNQALIFCVVSIVLMFLVIIYSLFSRSKFHYRFTHNYPYELLGQGKMRYPHLAIIVILISGMILSYIFGVAAYKSTLSIISAVFMAIATILILPLLYIEVENPKLHVAFSYLFFLFTFGGNILFGLSGLIESPIVLVPPCPLFISIIFLSMAALEFFSLINPKLWKIVFLEKCEEDGKTIYVRPKFSILATYEWLFIVANFLGIVSIFIATFFYSL